MLPGFPGVNIKESWLTILSEAKRPQTQCLSPKGEFWVCSEASFRMVQNSFQRTKGNPDNRTHSTEAKGQGFSLIKKFVIKSIGFKSTFHKKQETPVNLIGISSFR
jgi:hypothetical protein